MWEMESITVSPSTWDQELPANLQLRRRYTSVSSAQQKWEHRDTKFEYSLYLQCRHHDIMLLIRASENGGSRELAAKRQRHSRLRRLPRKHS